MMKLVVAFTYIVGTVAVALTARNFASETGIARWLVLYIVGVAVPAYATYLHFREFRRSNLPLTKERLVLVWSPVIAGGTTLATAIDIIARTLGALK